MKNRAARAGSWGWQPRLQQYRAWLTTVAATLTIVARPLVLLRLLKSFRWRYPPFSLTVLGVVMVVLLSSALVLDAIDDRVHAFDTAKSEISNRARFIGAHVSDMIKTFGLTAQNAAARIEEQTEGSAGGEDSGERLSGILEAAMIAIPGVEEIAYFDRSGVLRASYSRSAGLSITCGRTCPFLKRNQASPNGFYFGPIKASPDGPMLYGISRPVRAGQGALTGVVLVVFDPAYFANEFAIGSDDQVDTVALLDSEDRVVAAWSPSADRVRTSLARVRPDFAAAMNAATRSHLVVATQENLVAVHRMEAFPLWLGVARSKRAALKTWRDALMTHVLVAVGIDCLALLFVLIIARQFRQLRRVEASLQSAHDELETRVQIRTAELRQEIRDRQAIAKSLRASEERFLQFMNNIPAAVYMKDEAGRYIFVNPRFAEIYGVDSEDCLDRTGLELLPSSLATDDRARDEKVLEDDRPSAHEVAFERPDGVRNLAVFKFPIGLPSGRRLIGGVTLDITKRRTAERLLWHAQKMEALGQLAVGLAHDFNNLLFIILGNLEMIRDDSEVGTAIRELADEACWAASHGAELTDHLLTVFRKKPSVHEHFDAAAVVTKMSDLLSRTLGDRIEVDIRVGRTPLPVIADPTWFENAVLNLALNARDAMPKGGPLLIEVASSTHEHEWRGWRSTLAAGSYVNISFSDAGTGMAPEVVERIFEPFFTTKTAAKGSGLGLSMVYRFVTGFGGDIHVDSKLGKGTTITMILPLADSPGASTEQSLPVPERVAVGNERVLVVEDEPKERDLVVAMLEGLGYRTCEAEDGTGALAVLRDGPSIDLLLADVDLPGGMDGIELALQARTLKPGLRVQLMSGHIHDLTDYDGLSTDSALLQKPFGKVRLAEAIRQALSGTTNEPRPAEPVSESVG